MTIPANCLKHGPHKPGNCPECDELEEARSIVATAFIPTAPREQLERLIDCAKWSEDFVNEAQKHGMTVTPDRARQFFKFLFLGQEPDDAK